MKKPTVVLITLFTFSLFTSTTFADFRGCCSRHGGLFVPMGLQNAVTDPPLSSKCQAKGCDKCGSNTRSSTSSTTRSPYKKPTQTQKYQETPQPAPISNTSSSPSDFRCNGHVEYGIPGPENQLLCREGYAVGYDYDRKVPSWVAYRLTPDSVNKRFERSNRFKVDLEIPVRHRSTLSDYKGSGYDRGHMAASATVDFSYNAMMESFLLTNMTPQCQD